jgi:(E)-4-hydroxy-3-methylbut-2-enyl-diphosphate synthase
LHVAAQYYKRMLTPLMSVVHFAAAAAAAAAAALQLPDAGDAEARRALKRLQDVGVHVLAPAAELAAKPLAGGVAVMTLAEALAAGGCGFGGKPITAGKCRWHACIDGEAPGWWCGSDDPGRGTGSRWLGFWRETRFGKNM